MTKSPKKIRTLRHWKQRFHRNAKFVMRRKKTFGGKVYEPGDEIPAELQAHPTKLRRFWEAKVIELAEFEAPNVATGKAAEKQDSAVDVAALSDAEGASPAQPEPGAPTEAPDEPEEAAASARKKRGRPAKKNQADGEGDE